MTTELQTEKKEMPQSDLSLSVLEKIEKEHVAQVPRWQFTLSEYSMWALWAVSVCVGAVAFSIIIFFSMHAGFAPFEATHDSEFQFFLEVMPYAWVIVFILMAVLAHYNLRHTKRGYTFAVWQILLSSLVVSFMGGMVLHTTGMSFAVDSLVAQKVPFLPAFHTFEARIWQEPEQGRMIGTFIEKGSTQDVVMFKDSIGTVWKLDTHELNPIDLSTLYSEDRVRIIGVPATSTEAYFYGCGVLPWMPEKNISLRELKEEREKFVMRLREHHEKVAEALKATGTVPQFAHGVVCAKQPAVLRVFKQRP